jgi:hypothetical protein
MLGERALHTPQEGPHDSVAYRRDSLDCRMALLAVQQELGILSERRVGADSAYSFNPSSRWAVVAFGYLSLPLFGRTLPRGGRDVSAIWRLSASSPEILSVTIREEQSSHKSPVLGLPQGFGPWPCFLLVHMHLFMLRHGS